MEKLEINLIDVRGEVQDEMAISSDKRKAYSIFGWSVVLGILLTALQYVI